MQPPRWPAMDIEMLSVAAPRRGGGRAVHAKRGQLGRGGYQVHNDVVEQSVTILAMPPTRKRGPEVRPELRRHACRGPQGDPLPAPFLGTRLANRSRRKRSGSCGALPGCLALLATLEQTRVWGCSTKPGNSSLMPMGLRLTGHPRFGTHRTPTIRVVRHRPISRGECPRATSDRLLT
jgi:hypothetical protein